MISTIFPSAREEKTGDTHISAPVQWYVYPPASATTFQLCMLFVPVLTLVVLDDIDDISFSEYPTGSSKQEKSVLRRCTKNFTFNVESPNLFYLDKGQMGRHSCVWLLKKRKIWVFQECHGSDFGGHAGRDNTIQKIKDRYYWPQYYNDTVEMVRKINFSFTWHWHDVLRYDVTVKIMSC